MIKEIVIGVGLSLLTLNATVIKLNEEQEKQWKIKTINPTISHTLVLGEFMAEVTVPPQHLHTISLPFEAQVKKLFVATYDYIEEGQPLAEVTGRGWIEVQKQFIADAIELKHHGHIAERKNRLCNEGIIAKKQCHSANAEYQADQVKFEASKELLRGYGASVEVIDNIFDRLEIVQSIQVDSDISGRLLKLNVQTGKSTNPSDALFVIQKEGALWLEANILVQKAMRLSKKESVKLKFNDEVFQSQVLLHAPSINRENQTQKVRFSLPSSSKFIVGMRNHVTISKALKTLKIPKKSVITIDDKKSLFLKTEKGYLPMELKVLGEDKMNYFVKDNPKLHAPIATSSVLILKSLLESENE